MKKTLVMLLLMLGITFIYNPQTNSGFVYLNNETENYIILVDANSNVMRSYKAVPAGEIRLDLGFNAWLQDKISKGFPFKSVIIPYIPQDAKKQYDQAVPKKWGEVR